MIGIADTLPEAHRKGFVHRDIKPQNILVDQNERVYLVDSGLALADQDVGERLPAGGTPAYVSPARLCKEGPPSKGTRWNGLLDQINFLPIVVIGTYLGITLVEHIRKQLSLI